MSNLIVAVIGVLFASLLMLAGVNYLSPQHSIVMTTAGQSIGDVEQLTADYNNLAINLGRRPAGTDYMAVYNGQSQSAIYTSVGGVIARSASLPGNNGGWVFTPSCGGGAGNPDCFVLTVDGTGLGGSATAAQLTFAAAQAAALKEMNSSQTSRIGLAPVGAAPLAANPNPASWTLPSSAYLLVVQLSNSNAAAPPSCVAAGTCTYLAGPFIFDACPPGCGACTETVDSSWACTRSDGTLVAQSFCLASGTTLPTPPASANYLTCTYSSSAPSYFCAPACGASTATLTGYVCTRSDNVVVADSFCQAAGDAPPYTKSCTDNSACTICGTNANPSSAYPINGMPPSMNLCSLGGGPASNSTSNPVLSSNNTLFSWNCPNQSPCTASVINVGTDNGKSFASPPWTINGGSGAGGGIGHLCSVAGNDTDNYVHGETVSPTTYTWTCDGVVGTATVIAAAPGMCGSFNGGSDASAPWADGNQGLLCAGGATPTPTGLASGQWTWTCPGTNNGNSVSCSAIDSQPPTVACGSDSNPNFAFPVNGAPTSSNLCSSNGMQTSGGASTPVLINNNTLFSWTCANAPNTPIPCTANVVNVGTDSGQSYPTAPWTINGGSGAGGGIGHLCSVAGNDTDNYVHSETVGSTTYTWTCDGVTGTATIAASAAGVCGASAADTCGTGSTYNGNDTVDNSNTHHWTCAGGNGGGNSPLCSFASPSPPSPPPAPVNNACGTTQIYTCQQGTPGYGFVDNSYNYRWQCVSSTSPSVPCTLPAPITCGSDNSTTLSTAPWTSAGLQPHLCNDFGVDSVGYFNNPAVGNGSYGWYCGAQYCNALQQVNGQCDPTTLGGCLQGTPSGGTTDGNYIYNWSCTGTTANGGTSTNCTAPAPITCGWSDYRTNNPSTGQPLVPGAEPAQGLCNYFGSESDGYAHNEAAGGYGSWSWFCGKTWCSTTTNTCGSNYKVTFSSSPIGNGQDCQNSNPTTIDDIGLNSTGANQDGSYYWSCGSQYCYSLPPGSPPAPPATAACGSGYDTCAPGGGNVQGIDAVSWSCVNGSASQYCNTGTTAIFDSWNACSQGCNLPSYKTANWHCIRTTDSVPVDNAYCANNGQTPADMSCGIDNSQCVATPISTPASTCMNAGSIDPQVLFNTLVSAVNDTVYTSRRGWGLCSFYGYPIANDYPYTINASSLDNGYTTFGSQPASDSCAAQNNPGLNGDYTFFWYCGGTPCSAEGWQCQSAPQGSGGNGSESGGAGDGGGSSGDGGGGG